MASNDSTKKNIRLSMFKSWGFKMFGVKIKKNDQDEYVKYVLQTKTRYIAIKQ